MARSGGRGADQSPGAQVILKLELFQHTGTFKPRGRRPNNVMSLTPEARAKGIVAVSAGNHAIAAAYAAKTTGVSAKVVMIQTANPARVARAKALGAEVIMAGDEALQKPSPGPNRLPRTKAEPSFIPSKVAAQPRARAPSPLNCTNRPDRLTRSSCRWAAAACRAACQTR